MFLLKCLLYLIPIANATLSSRLKRFLTPTTYPAVPTTFPVPSTMGKRTVQPILSSFSDSRPVSCPVKRATRSRHVELDSDMMREIYLREVGAWDQRLVAETLKEAEESFIDLSGISNSTLTRKQDVLREIKRPYHQRKKTEVTRKDIPFYVSEAGADTLKHFHPANGTLSNLWSKLSSIRKLFGLESNSRMKRSTDGTETTTEYCHPRGTKTADGYIHMCSTCAFTTKLPKDKFPRYINEVGCDSNDCNCFTINDISHGKCRPKILTVRVLRKVTSGCRLIIHDGQHLITDNWELYDQPLKVGCECVIDKRSPFAAYIG